METIQPQPANYPTSSSNGSSNRFYSPLVLNIAASEGVSMTELEKIPGTGNEGRVTKKDILQYVSERKSGAGSHESTSHELRSQQEVSVIKESAITLSNSATHNSQLIPAM